MIAVRIGPDLRMAVVGSPAFFKKRSQPHTPQDLDSHDCINLRLPTYGTIYAWEFQRDGHELPVRVQGQLMFNNTSPMLEASLAGIGLAYVPEDMVSKYIAEGSLKRALEDWSPSFPSYHL